MSWTLHLPIRADLGTVPDLGTAKQFKLITTALQRLVVVWVQLQTWLFRCGCLGVQFPFMGGKNPVVLSAFAFTHCINFSFCVAGNNGKAELNTDTWAFPTTTAPRSQPLLPKVLFQETALILPVFIWHRSLDHTKVRFKHVLKCAQVKTTTKKDTVQGLTQSRSCQLWEFMRWQRLNRWKINHQAIETRTKQRKYLKIRARKNLDGNSNVNCSQLG